MVGVAGRKGLLEFRPTRFGVELRPPKLMYPSLTVCFSYRFNFCFLSSPYEVEGK